VEEIWPSVFDGHRLDAELRVAGVLGQDVLAGLSYTLDYPRRTLSWGGPPPSNARSVRLPLEWIEGCPVVRAAPEGAPRPLRLIPDTGASHVVLFGADGVEHPLFHIGDGAVRLDTLNEYRVARPLLIPELRIGAVVLRNPPAAMVDAGQREADGLLPLHLFRRVTINAPERYIVLEPR
jgi:hypothetical protein